MPTDKVIIAVTKEIQPCGENADRLRIKFNPAELSDVDQVKLDIYRLMEKADEYRDSDWKSADKAKEHLEAAAMYLVKAITYESYTGSQQA